MPKLESQDNRPLQITFKGHLKALVYFHLEEHHFAQHLLQVLEQEGLTHNEIAPEVRKNHQLMEKLNRNLLAEFI